MEFWSAQLSAIQEEVESRVKGYQVSLVQRQANVAIAATEREKARIEQAALEEQLRILGMKSKPISPEISQKLDQALAKAEETIKSTWARLDDAQRQGVENTILWGKKCMAFSREQLAKPRN
jgi:methionyl-tRNA synthetase